MQINFTNIDNFFLKIEDFRLKKIFTILSFCSLLFGILVQSYYLNFFNAWRFFSFSQVFIDGGIIVISFLLIFLVIVLGGTIGYNITKAKGKFFYIILIPATVTLYYIFIDIFFKNLFYNWLITGFLFSLYSSILFFKYKIGKGFSIESLLGSGIGIFFIGIHSSLVIGNYNNVVINDRSYNIVYMNIDYIFTKDGYIFDRDGNKFIPTNYIR